MSIFIRKSHIYSQKPYLFAKAIFIRKSHNVSVLLYHAVCGTKYRRAVLNAEYRRAVLNADVESVLKEICLEISVRYEITFLESRFLRSGRIATVCIF